MKKALKRRFVLSAMLAFLIVISLLVGSIAFINYREDMRMADAFLKALLDEDTRLMQAPPPNWFGYQFTHDSLPAGFYTITTDAEGEILELDQAGILQSETDVSTLAKQIAQEQKVEGKAGAYQFRTIYDAENGTIRMVLLDRTIQIISLYNVLKTGAAVGAGCLAALFFILQPIAGHLANEWLRKTEQQKQFFTNAGHELKTPVAIILSNTEALELLEGESKYSRNIHQQTQRLDKLIKQLLMIARLDELRYRSETKRLDFSALVRESCLTFSENLTSAGMQFETEINDGCMLRGHSESLQQMMNVLLDNAVRYGKDQSVIYIRLHSTHKHVELSIVNMAEKLPECKPEELFERFYRGDSSHTRKDDSGCGVGLSAAKTIVKLHRGSIRIDYPTSECFRVSILFPAWY